MNQLNSRLDRNIYKSRSRKEQPSKENDTFNACTIAAFPPSYFTPSTPVVDLGVLLVRVVNRALWPNGASGHSIRLTVNVDTPFDILS